MGFAWGMERSVPFSLLGNAFGVQFLWITLVPGEWISSPGSYLKTLKSVGQVLKLTEQKMDEGTQLIKYFSIPCLPTKSNGGRTRNLPEHYREKWDLFKAYNKRDVEVELAIQEKLKNFPVPEEVWEEYHIDQGINDRGIRIDKTLVKSAVSIDALTREELTKRLQELTGVANPASVMQMRQWLSDHGVATESLDKKAVKEMLKTVPENVGEVLKLRAQLAKASVKKYQAMQKTMCADGRARGMFQFYGANRSGRWAGRHIQLQNLPQNHLKDLDAARAFVREGDYDTLRLLYDNDNTEIDITGMSKASGTIKVKLTYSDGLTKAVTIKVKKAK